MNLKKFENSWTNKIKEDLLKSFPNDFIETEATKIVELPGKTLLKGSELFGAFEIIDTNGNPQMTVNSIAEMKYILYANRNLSKETAIPKNEEEILKAVKSYEGHLDNLIKKIREDYSKNFSEENKAVEVSHKIFQNLNLKRY